MNYKEIGLLLHGHGILCLLIVLAISVFPHNLLEPELVLLVYLVLLDNLVATFFEVVIIRYHALRREAKHPLRIASPEILGGRCPLGGLQSKAHSLALFLVLILITRWRGTQKWLFGARTVLTTTASSPEFSALTEEDGLA